MLVAAKFTVTFQVKQPPTSLLTALLQVPFEDYFGYLNSGAAFSASLVVFIDASHLSFLLS